MALGAVALLAAVVAGATGAHGQEDPASRALLYLEALQRSDGSIPAPPGSFDPSALYAIAAAAAGYDPNSLAASSGASVVSYLKATAGAECTSSTPARCGRLIQAAVAASADSHAFGGIDLLRTLEAAFAPSSGRYGDGEAFTQALAIQGLVAAGATVPREALSFLENAQDADGGWDYLDVKDDSANVYDTSDTNSTAMVLMALDASGDHSHDAAALSWLAKQQDADGGFRYQPGSGTDPDSTALVLQAIVATGGDPRSSSWTASGHTPISNLIAAQDQASGGFVFPGNSATDPFTTAQVPAGLLLEPYPVKAVAAPGFSMTSESHAALAALQYLQAQPIPSSAADPAPLELYAIAAAAAGYDPKALRDPTGTSLIDHLAAHASAECATAGACGELVQAVIAAGMDPHAFGGRDLVAALDATYSAATGQFGDGEAFTQALAIQGLIASGRPVPAPALTFLAGAQDADGGWDYLDVKGDGGGSDTNSTAIALMALDASGDHSHDASALSWLATQQDGDGGFPYQVGFGSDPDSTALAVQALMATGQDPAARAWAPAGRTPIVYLVASQAPSGGFTFPGNPSPDAFTTSQVPFAFERVPFPVPFGSRAWYQPGATFGTQLNPRGPTPTPPASGPPAGPVTPAAAPPAAGHTPSVAPVASAGVASVVAPSTPRSPAPVKPAAGPPPGASTGALLAPSQPPGGLPGALLYALVAASAALVAGGVGVALSRR